MLKLIHEREKNIKCTKLNISTFLISVSRICLSGRMYPDYARYGRTLWSGVVKNKENTLSKAELICYSNDELPFSM